MNSNHTLELPASTHTTEELTNYLTQSSGEISRLMPQEKRRYVIYLRKSTDAEDRQIRSLEDQKRECLELAKHKNITVRNEDVFEESASAKKSGNRPIFDEILQGFRVGKFHGLITWSPDRLSRNMKEAGEVIEMIDMEQIQDLQFKTYQFENTPNGKMMLGILFATSKQYSDKLAVDVSRGITGNIRDGKYTGLRKHGYYVTEDTAYFVPDTENWNLLRQSIVMRLEGHKTLDVIADYLNESGFTQRKNADDEGKPIKFDKKKVGSIFKDSFYCGVYKYGNNVVNLSEIQNFLPLMTVDEYIELNKEVANDFNVKPVSNASAKRLEYGFMRRKVICDYCDRIMKFQLTKLNRGKHAGHHMMSYYCENKQCERHKPDSKIKKSIRAKYISAAIEYTIRHCTIRSKEAYDGYVNKIKADIAASRSIAKRKLNEAKTSLDSNTALYHKYQLFQVESPQEYAKHHKGSLERYAELMNISQRAINQCEQELEELNRAIPTKEEFSELMDNYLLKVLNTEDLLEKDMICNEIVANLRAGNNSVSVITLNPPYDLMADLTKVSLGRGERT